MLNKKLSFNKNDKKSEEENPIHAFRKTSPVLQFRISNRRCSVRKGVLRNFPKFKGKELCQSLFFIKSCRPITLLKKRLRHRCFPVYFAKFLRTPFLQNTSGRLYVRNIFLQKSCRKWGGKTSSRPLFVF